MLPLSYQTTLRAHLSEAQYLTLQLLLLLLQSHRPCQTFDLSQRLSSTNSISQSQTELTTLFSLTSVEYQTFVVSLN
jgi:hypothetical protein